MRVATSSRARPAAWPRGGEPNRGSNGDRGRDRSLPSPPAESRGRARTRRGPPVSPAMQIDRIDLRLVHLPLVRPFRTSSSRKDRISHILVRVEAGGAVGWGECACPADPYYCPETTET